MGSPPHTLVVECEWRPGLRVGGVGGGVPALHRVYLEATPGDGQRWCSFLTSRPLAGGVSRTTAAITCQVGTGQGHEDKSFQSFIQIQDE